MTAGATDAAPPYVHRDYPEFSWSSSRELLFERCRRRYFWHYYGSSNGWERTSSDVAKTAWRLKNLTSFDVQVGTEVHERAKDYVASVLDGRPIPVASLIETTMKALDELYARSQDLESFQARPKRHPVAYGAYYKRGVLENQLLRARARAVKCIDNLVSSAIWDEVGRAGKEGTVMVEPLSTFQVGGITVYAVPDLVYLTNNEWTIVDWKTGVADEGSDQLAVYGLYIREALSLTNPTSHYPTKLVHLQSGKVDVVRFTDSEILAVRTRIECSAADMRDMLVDILTNRPKAMSGFQLTDDPSECRICPFFQLCEPELVLLGRAGVRLKF
ncbi:MAG: PD-(D/E)XK nuclease family protein [Gemmatimonadaceae bacterium]